MYPPISKTGVAGRLKSYCVCGLLVVITSIFLLPAAKSQKAGDTSGAPALQSKLAALEKRGLDYSGALAFWPLGEGEGIFSKAFGSAAAADPDVLATAAIDVNWVKESRLKGQACLKFAPPNATVNGGGRRVLPASVTAFTIEGWCRPDWLRGGGMIFHQDWAANQIGFYATGHKSLGTATLIVSQNGTTESVSGTPEQLPGGWMHAACTYDGASRRAAVFVNGKLALEKELPWDKISLGGTGWRIGGSDPLSGMGGQFNGLIDEVVVWDSVLGAAEIARHCELGKPDPGTEVTPVLRPAALDLNEKTAPALKDIVAHFDFEGGLAPSIANSDLAANFKADFLRDAPAANGAATVKPGEPRYRAGKFGKGLYLGSKGPDTPKGEAVRFDLGHLPQAEGSIAFWMRPDWVWNQGEHILYRGNYRMNTATISSGRVMTEAGQGEQRELGGPELPAERTAQLNTAPATWHYVVSSWYRDGTSRVFVDGVDSGPSYTPLRDFGRTLMLGSDDLAGTERDTGGARPDAVIDELTIFGIGLSPAQVTSLYRAKRPLVESAPGILYTGWRTAFRRGEKMTFEFRCYGMAARPYSALLRQGAATWTLQQGTTAKKVVVAYDSQKIRPGKYQLEMAVKAQAGAPGYSTSVDVLIRQDDERPIPFTALAFLRDEHDEDKLAEAGIDNVRSHVTDKNVLDRLYRKGLNYSPELMTANLGPALQKSGVPAEQWQQVWWRPGGKTESAADMGPSPFSPVAQEAKRKHLREVVQWCKDHPGVRYVNLYDEYGIRLDVSKDALDYFRQQTGLAAPPDFKPRESRAWPDNDPYVKWIDTFATDYWSNMNLGIEDRILTQELHRFAPGLRTFSTPSSGMGEIDFENVEIYPYLLEGPLTRSVKNDASEMRADGLMDLYNASQRVKPRKPQWPLLGWFNMPGQPMANEGLKVMTQVCLAKGAQGILIGPDTWVRNRPDMVSAVRALVDTSDKYGSFFKSLKYYDAGTVGVLVNEYGVMSVADPGSPRSLANTGAMNIVSVLRAAGVPVEIIGPRQVLEGRLDKCEALVLAGYTQSTRSLHDKILAFEARGGLIFHDDISWDYSSPRGALVPKSSKRLPWESNNTLREGDIERLRPLVEAQITSRLKNVPVRSSDSFLVPFRAVALDCEVYFVINHDLQRPHDGAISVAGASGSVYELLSGKGVPTTTAGGRLTWNTAVEKGGWQIFVKRNKPIGSVRVTTSVAGSQISYRIETRDVAGVAAGHVPLQLRVLDPQGRETVYGSYLASGEKGVAAGIISLAGLNDPSGNWTIVARELLGGKTGAARVAWKGGQ